MTPLPPRLPRRPLLLSFGALARLLVARTCFLPPVLTRCRRRRSARDAVAAGSDSSDSDGEAPLGWRLALGVYLAAVAAALVPYLAVRMLLLDASSTPWRDPVMTLLLIPALLVAWHLGPGPVVAQQGATLLLLATLPLPTAADPLALPHLPAVALGDALVHTALYFAIGLTVGIARLRGVRLQVAHVRQVAALEHASAQKEAFMGVAAHELRTPLTALRLLLQVQLRHALRYGAEDDEQTIRTVRHMEEALVATDRLNDTVQEMLDDARLAQHRIIVNVEEIDLGDVLRAAARHVQMAHPDRVLHVYVPLDRVPVEGDPDRLYQVACNYLTNAIKFSAAPEPVELSLHYERSRPPAAPAAPAAPADAPHPVALYATARVTDHGTGVPVEEQERIWDRFYQSGGVPRKGGGSLVGLGLGLHLCRAIVEQHHGEWGVTSSPGSGSTFWFRLRVLRPVTANTAAVAPTASLAPVTPVATPFADDSERAPPIPPVITPLPVAVPASSVSSPPLPL